MCKITLIIEVKAKDLENFAKAIKPFVKVTRAASVTSTTYPTLEQLELSARTQHCLKLTAMITTVEGLCKKTKAELLSIPNFGKKSLQEVIDELAKFNLSLAERRTL